VTKNSTFGAPAAKYRAETGVFIAYEYRVEGQRVALK
jgi:hypothetical protein